MHAHSSGRSRRRNELELAQVSEGSGPEVEWATWIGETSYIASSAEGKDGGVKKPAYV